LITNSVLDVVLHLLLQPEKIRKARKSLSWKLLCNLLAGNIIIIIWLLAASGFAWFSSRFALVSSSRFEQKLWVKMKEEAE
jgi:hypothetical protein